MSDYYYSRDPRNYSRMLVILGLLYDNRSISKLYSKDNNY